MKYILNFDLNILNIFQVLKINGFVNYLLLNKYGNVFQYEVKCFEIISFKDKLKVNIENRLKIVHHRYFGIINSLWNL